MISGVRHVPLAATAKQAAWPLSRAHWKPAVGCADKNSARNRPSPAETRSRAGSSARLRTAGNPTDRSFRGSDSGAPKREDTKSGRQSLLFGCRFRKDNCCDCAFSLSIQRLQGEVTALKRGVFFHPLPFLISMTVSVLTHTFGLLAFAASFASAAQEILNVSYAPNREF